jgi:hypothetical protein
VIVKYELTRATEVTYCQDEHCDHYISILEPCVEFTISDNENGDTSEYIKCLNCAVETIKDDIEELSLLLAKIENI